MEQPTPLVVAHRGASARAAEHTLAAYQLAIEQGADGLECDVRLTRDGHLVCLHDRRVNRTSTGRGAVSGADLATLAEHDYGSWHHELPDSADELVADLAPTEPAGTGLLTFERLLRLVRDTGREMRLFVETKHPVRYSGLVEAALVASLARHGLAEPSDRDGSPVLVMSFSPLALRRIRRDAPRLPTVQLTVGLRGISRGRLPPWADVAGPSVRAIRADPGFVARAAERGHPTYCWTVDEPADVALCRAAGVRYLATNRPDETRALLAGGHP